MKKKLAGYRDKISIRPGDTVQFMIHSAEGESYEADLVRILHGSRQEGSPGLVLEEVPAAFAGEKPGQVQDIRAGSFGFITADAQSRKTLDDYAVGVAVFPSRGNGKAQVLVSANDTQKRVLLFINAEGCLTAQGGGSTFSLVHALPEKRWSFVGLSYNSDAKELTVCQRPLGIGVADALTASAETKMFKDVALSKIEPSTILFAAQKEGQLGSRILTIDHFNGRLDSPRLINKPVSEDELFNAVETTDFTNNSSIEGAWDFSKGISGNGFEDLSGKKRHGQFKNCPTRAVCGFRWTGDEQDWKQAQREYGAVHFHEDDIYDSEWEPSFTWTVPEGTRSGAYAARVQSGGETDYVTVFVVPGKKDKKAPVAFLASTATYLAYANETVMVRIMQVMYGRTPALSPETDMLLNTPAFGLSQYDHHTDGSGIHYSSYLRPIMNMRPDVREWAFCADTAIIHWLEQGGWEYDVITDHDLHREGADLLNDYQTVITATHPEYYSTHMLDGVEGYLSDGGRFMYMGGNGFYWRVGFNDAWPAAMEVRRAEDGTRAWIAEPGEYYQSFTGEYGGLWRRNRRAPNQLVGVGFAAQGFDESRPYERTDAADDPRVRFMFEGVDDHVIGDFGLRGGGAGGEEIDRYDPSLGSPAHALVVATAGNMPPDMLRGERRILLDTASRARSQCPCRSHFL